MKYLILLFVINLFGCSSLLKRKNPKELELLLNDYNNTTLDSVKYSKFNFNIESFDVKYYSYCIVTEKMEDRVLVFNSQVWNYAATNIKKRWFNNAYPRCINAKYSKEYRIMALPL